MFVFPWCRQSFCCFSFSGLDRDLVVFPWFRQRSCCLPFPDLDRDVVVFPRFKQKSCCLYFPGLEILFCLSLVQIEIFFVCLSLVQINIFTSDPYIFFSEVLIVIQFPQLLKIIHSVLYNLLQKQYNHKNTNPNADTQSRRNNYCINLQ